MLFIGPGQVNLTLGGATELTGKHFHVVNSTGQPIDYYSSPPSAPADPGQGFTTLTGTQAIVPLTPYTGSDMGDSLLGIDALWGFAMLNPNLTRGTISFAAFTQVNGGQLLFGRHDCDSGGAALCAGCFFNAGESGFRGALDHLFRAHPLHQHPQRGRGCRGNYRVPPDSHCASSASPSSQLAGLAHVGLLELAGGNTGAAARDGDALRQLRFHHFGFNYWWAMAVRQRSEEWFVEHAYADARPIEAGGGKLFGNRYCDSGRTAFA